MYEIPRELLLDYANWQESSENSKFKKGDAVIFKAKSYIVQGVNDIEEEGIEYLLEDYGFVVWEEELTEDLWRYKQ